MDFEKFVNGKIYSAFDKIYNFIMINIIWFLLTVFGLGVFTFVPATMALFIMHNSLIQQKDVPIFKAFFVILKKEYWKAQKLFIIFFLLGLILYFDIRMYYEQIINKATFFNNLGFWVSVIFVLIYLITLIHVFMVSLYFPEWKTFKKIKYAFLFAIAYPFRSFLILVITVGSILVILYFPVLIPLIFLVLGSLLTYVTIKILKPRYDRLLKERKSITVTDYLE